MMISEVTAMSLPEEGKAWWPTDTRALLVLLLEELPIAGLESVRVLSSGHRYEKANDKIFFVLGSHDIDRDEQIVRLMIRFEGVDYDLVPAASAAMVPSAAVAIW